jgi:hypothetical protein
MKNFSFFFYFSMVLAAGSVLVFSIHAIVLPGNVSAIHPLMVYHALAMYLWYGLLLVQAILISKNNYKFHQRLGFLSSAIALGILLTGIMITLYSLEHSKSILFFAGNSLMLIFFTILYSLGIFLRKKIEDHKRLIMFASIAIYIPVAFRAAALLGDRAYAAIIYIALILVIAIWELLTRKKMKLVTAVCTLSLILMVALTFILAKSPVFASFVFETFGITS